MFLMFVDLRVRTSTVFPSYFHVVITVHGRANRASPPDMGQPWLDTLVYIYILYYFAINGQLY